ncbi:hypothetical protein RI367_006217 [Sorochytrium milnesiophthora]
MSASTASTTFTLPRLPPELVEEIVVHVGVDACAALRHLPALRRVLAAYVHASNYTNDCEKAMLKVLVDCRWSEGVQAMIDADIRHPFSRVVELDWNGIVLPVSSIQKVYLWCLAANSYRDRHARELASILTYARIAAGASCPELLRWGVRQVPDFARNLSSQYIKHGRNLDQLRAMHQELGVYLHERDLAKSLLPLAARYGRLDLVQALDGINPEVLQEHSEILKLAAQHGHLQVVQYAFGQFLPALPQEVLEIAMRDGHIELLQQLQDNGHMKGNLCSYSVDRYHEIASAVAAETKIARVIQILKQFNSAFSVTDAVARDASRAYLPTLQQVIRTEQSTTDARVFCAAARAGRTDIVDWMLSEFPQWTSAEAINYAAGAWQRKLAHRLSDHFDVPLKDCPLQSRHLQALVKSGHLHKLKWVEKHCEVACDAPLLLSGISSRNLAVAQLLHRHCQALEFTGEMLTEACRTGNLRMVQWVYQHLPATVKLTNAIDAAANGGFEVIVEWLHHNTSLPCATYAMTRAVRLGRLDLVRFFQEHRYEGCPSLAVSIAVREGHLDVADYLRLHHDEGCWIVKHYPEQLTADAVNSAAFRSRIDVIQYFHTLPNAPFSPEAMDRAAASGDLDLVRWFHNNRKEGCTAEAMSAAAHRDSLSIVKFLHKHGYPMSQWFGIGIRSKPIHSWWRSIQTSSNRRYLSETKSQGTASWL